MESITKTKRIKKKRQVIADNPAESKIDIPQFLIAIAVVLAFGLLIVYLF